MTSHDVVVIGAGPAGLAAAVGAARAGADVHLVDAGPRPGGQYWRHGAVGPVRVPEQTTFDLLRRALADLERRGRVRTSWERQVWGAWREADGVRVEATGTRPGVAPLATRAARVVLCPGAVDRQLPVPGWELPGVMAAGGLQALVKGGAGAAAVAGKRVVLAGTGPFLLAVADTLLRAGAHVVAVCDAASPAGWLRHPAALTGATHKAVEGARLAATLARHRVPFRARTAVRRILGTDAVTGVRLARAGPGGVLRAGADDDVPADLVGIGWGFTPAVELALQLGLATRVDVDGSLVVAVDADQRSSVPGVLVAGEATGVGGAALAIAEGGIAGLNAVVRGSLPADVVRQMGRWRATVRAQRRFARAMHQVHRVPAGWTGWLADDTLVCRCEEVTWADVGRARLLLGADDARTVKQLTRVGQGWCQGRMCGSGLACALAAPSGSAPSEADLVALAARPLATPVPLRELADGADA